MAKLLDKLVAAQHAGNADEVLALKAELRRLIDADPSAAVAGVFEALRGLTDLQSLGTLAALLSSEPGLARRPEVLQALTEMAQKDDSPARRATAVRTLGNLPGGDASRIDLLTGMGRSDLDPSVREAAAVAIGSLASGSPGAVAATAALSLAQGYANEQDPRVRSMLLYGIRDTRDSTVANTLLQALSQDSDMTARQAAADMLGEVAAAYRPQTLTALATQLGQESDPNFRSTIVTSIVGCGGLNAIPVLQQLRDGAGNVQAEIDDYLVGLSSGEDNMDKLQAIRLARQQARGEIAVDDRP